jgi:surfeit locus 1 family protein
MRFGVFVFRPGLWPTLAGLFFFGLTLWLGNWQLSRAEYKQSLQARYDRMQQDGVVRIGAATVAKEDLLYRTVEVRGAFVPGQDIFVDNRVYKTRAGYHVFSPFQIEGTAQHVLVNRGWVEVVNGSREALPEVKRVDGVLILRGIAVDTQSRYLELKGAEPQGKLWQNLDYGRYQQHFGKSLQNVLIEQTSDTGDGLVRDWPRPDTGVGTHISYAIQWFGLAAAIVVLWLVLNVKREKEDS